MFEANKVGPDRHPRFIISTSAGCVWTGDDWSTDKTKALVYANPKLVERDIRRLADRWERMPKPLRLEVKLVFEIDAEQPVDLERLRDYLKRSVEIDIDDDDEPLPDDVRIQTSIRWDTLKTERKQRWK